MKSGAVLDILLQFHRNINIEKTFFECLLINYDVPNVIHTD